MATRLPCGSGWYHELGDVEHLVDVLDADHRGLAEHGVEGLGPDPGGTGTVPGRDAVGADPDLTTMTGFVAARRRAMRENLRGLPMDSR